ncbi:TonB-dependent receptor [Gluconacetobacter johannae]|nr:TonB-dependent receptor [Gluconacetobacter johannae]
MKRLYLGSIFIAGVLGVAEHGAYAQTNADRATPGHVAAGKRPAPVAQVTRRPAAAQAELVEVTRTQQDRAAQSIDRETRDLQKVPQAATRLDSKLLAAEHITSLPQAARLLPTVQLNISNPHGLTINIRGLGAAGTAPTDGLEGGVGVYVDGVYRPRPATALVDTADLDGITVMRGPTGTESGISTTAGSISLTTAAPTFTREVYGEAGVGNFDYARWRIGLNTPLIKDKLALRVSGTGLSNSGWVQNIHGNGDINGQTNRTVRAQLLFRPTDDLSVRLIGDYNHWRENCCIGGLYHVITHRTDGSVVANNLYARSALVGYTPLAPSNAPYRLDSDTLSDANQEDMGLSAEVNWRHRGVNLTSITAYRVLNWWPHNDTDAMGTNAGALNNNKQNERQFTQEIRASGSWGRRADYTLGGFYMWQEVGVPSTTVLGTTAADWYGYGPAYANALTGYRVSSYAQPTTNAYALFANSTWHATSRLDVVTGIRYTYETKTGSFSQWQTPPSGYDSALLPPGAAQTAWNGFGKTRSYGAHQDNGFVTGQFVLNYHVNDHLLVYGRYARGAKSGGLNLVSLPAGASPNVGKETDDAFEVGAKSNFLNDRLLVSGALYQTNDHNYQVTQLAPYNGTLVSYLGNAKEVRVRGAELDVHYHPVANLATSLSVAYNDAEYASFDNAGAPPEVNAHGQAYSLTGTRVPFDPRWAIAASVQYHHALGLIGLPKFEGVVGGSYTYRTDINTTANNSAYGWVQGYGILNLNVGFRPTNTRWELDGFINNATDVRRTSLIFQNGASAGTMLAYVTQPLNFGFILKAHY